MSKYYGQLTDLEAKRSQLIQQHEDLEKYAKKVRAYLGEASNADFGLEGNAIASTINKACTAIRTEGNWEGDVAESCCVKLDELQQEVLSQGQDFELAYTAVMDAWSEKFLALQEEIRECSKNLDLLDKANIGTSNFDWETLLGL